MNYDICPHENLCKRTNLGGGWVCQVPTAFYSLGRKCRVKTQGEGDRGREVVAKRQKPLKTSPVAGDNTERRVSLP